MPRSLHPTRRKIVGLVTLAACAGVVAVAEHYQPTAAAKNNQALSRLSIRYVQSVDRSATPSARDQIRRTAVLPGIAEFTVMDVQVASNGGQGQTIVVDTSILSMRPQELVPTQEIDVELTDSAGKAYSGLVARPSLSTPLIGGDDRRFYLSWPLPATGPLQLRVSRKGSTDVAIFAIQENGVRP